MIQSVLSNGPSPVLFQRHPSLKANRESYLSQNLRFYFNMSSLNSGSGELKTMRPPVPILDSTI